MTAIFRLTEQQRHLAKRFISEWLWKFLRCDQRNDDKETRYRIRMIYNDKAIETVSHFAKFSTTAPNDHSYILDGDWSLCVYASEILCGYLW